MQLILISCYIFKHYLSNKKYLIIIIVTRINKGPVYIIDKNNIIILRILYTTYIDDAIICSYARVLKKKCSCDPNLKIENERKNGFGIEI